MSNDLPELPRPQHWRQEATDTCGFRGVEAYTPDEMRAYAEAAILAHRERQAGEAVAWRFRFHTDTSFAGGVNVRPWVLTDKEPAQSAEIESEALGVLASLPAPQAVQAESMRERLQKQCSAWGAYWRASDAHGVELTKPQAIELLQDALGVEVEIKDNGCQACDGTGMIGGPSYYSPDEGGVPCPDCAEPSPDGKAEQAEAQGWRDVIQKALDAWYRYGSERPYDPDIEALEWSDEFKALRALATASIPEAGVPGNEGSWQATGEPTIFDFGHANHRIETTKAEQAEAPNAWAEHYDELKATLTGAHGVMENLSAMERKIGPLGSHGRGYTHKITKALRHLESLHKLLATQPTASNAGEQAAVTQDEHIGALIAKHFGTLGADEYKRIHLLLRAALQPKQVAQDSAVLAYLDDLKDDAAAHIWPDDLERCQTRECVVGVTSVRMGSPNGNTVPLFSREQVAEALRAARARGEGADRR